MIGVDRKQHFAVKYKDTFIELRCGNNAQHMGVEKYKINPQTVV